MQYYNRITSLINVDKCILIGKIGLRLPNGFLGYYYYNGMDG